MLDAACAARDPNRQRLAKQGSYPPVLHTFDGANTEALVRTVVNAERDGLVSAGLFRVPGYVTSLRSGKVNGHAIPAIKHASPVVVKVHGDNGYAPLAIERGVPALAEAAKQFGVAVMSLTHTYHFAALWPETEALAAEGLIGLACVCYTPLVAPAGGKEPLFGTNPIAFAWPRPGRNPVVVDMAPAAMSVGEVQIAAREGHSVPRGTGLGPDGQPTTDQTRSSKAPCCRSVATRGRRSRSWSSCLGQSRLAARARHLPHPCPRARFERRVRACAQARIPRQRLREVPAHCRATRGRYVARVRSAYLRRIMSV